MTKGEDTRRAILAHGAREAARVGLEGLSIGGLAKDLGLSKSGLFAHFASKEALQIQILDEAAEQFTDAVIRPALRAPRGEPRLRALFENWLGWLDRRRAEACGCLFVAASAELDDRPGAVRDRLVAQQRDLLELVANVARSGVTEGQFRADLDCGLFAFEAHALVLACHHAARLMGDPAAFARARAGFERLLDAARA